MPGSLVKIQETSVSSATASVTLSGINSTYDVYYIEYNNVKPVNDVVTLNLRVTESGTANSTSNYDTSYTLLRSTTSFYYAGGENADKGLITGDTTGTNTGEEVSGFLYVFNANDSGKATNFSNENNFIEHNGNFQATSGQITFTNTSAVDGVQFLFSAGNIASGNFKIYGFDN